MVFLFYFTDIYSLFSCLVKRNETFDFETRGTSRWLLEYKYFSYKW